MHDLEEIPCVDEEQASLLEREGYETLEDVYEAAVDDLTEITEIGEETAEELSEQVAEVIEPSGRPERASGKPSGEAVRPDRREGELELAPAHHRRLLDIYNEAIAAEELAEHPLPEIRPEDPEELLEYRDRHYPYGFTHIDQVIDPGFIEPEIVPDLDGLLPLLYGQWSNVLTPPHPQDLPGGFKPGHAAMLHTEEVLILPSADLEASVIYDPAQNSFRLPGNQPSDYIYCSGHSFLADGKLLVVGGGGGSASSAIDSAWVFDPDDKTNSRRGVWSKVRSSPNGQEQTMERVRWYPTCVTLGGGRVLIAGGLDKAGNQQKQMEIYDYDTSDGSLGQFSLVDATGGNLQGGERDFAQYAGLHLLPDGQVFHSRADRFDPMGTKNAFFEFTGGTTGNWDDLADTMAHPDRSHGMSAQILERTSSGDWVVKVLVVGGGPGGNPHDTAEIINLSQNKPKWNGGGHNPMRMDRARRALNVVLLPTGSAFVCGGIESRNTPCALFDPDTGTWSQMADLKQERTHHSVAVLLPSGKVMMTGGDHAQDSNSIEIFEPPYVHGGGRPTIDASSVPNTVHHGSTFTITSPQAADVQEAVLVRPMAVTHFTDTEQRVVPMEFSQTGTTLTITAPNGNHPHPVAPRGHYMLFVVDSDGDPSEGEFVFLH